MQICCAFDKFNQLIEISIENDYKTEFRSARNASYKISKNITSNFGLFQDEKKKKSESTLLSKA